jgi:hypothetical protein
MPAWATVAIAIGPALITACVALFAARFQRDTSLAETNAATERLRIEHAETERSHRQGVYHQFLTLIERQDATMMGFAPLSEELFRDWLSQYYAIHQGMSLFGAQSVRDALTPLADMLDEEGAEARIIAKQTGEPFHEAIRAPYAARRNETFERMDELREAMRVDVAPEVVLRRLGPALEQHRRATPTPAVGSRTTLGTTGVTGRPSPSTRLMRSRRSHLDARLGSVDTMISSKSPSRTASWTASNGSGPPTSPFTGPPAARRMAGRAAFSVRLAFSPSLASGTRSVNWQGPAAARPSIACIRRAEVAVLLATTRTCLTCEDSIGPVPSLLPWTHGDGPTPPMPPQGRLASARTPFP